MKDFDPFIFQAKSDHFTDPTKGRDIYPTEDLLLSGSRRGDRLINKYIELPPPDHFVPVSSVTLRKSGVALWSVMTYLQSVNGDRQTVVNDFEITKRELFAILAVAERYHEKIAPKNIPTPVYINFQGRAVLDEAA